MEGNNCGLMKLLSQHLHGGTEVEHDSPQHSLCDGQDSGWIPPGYVPDELHPSRSVPVVVNACHISAAVTALAVFPELILHGDCNVYLI